MNEDYGLSEKARKLKNEYLKNWKRRNPDKVKAAHKRYWEKQAAILENINVTDTSITPVTDKISVTNVCLNCGKEFAPKRSDAKFCSNNCRVNYNRKK